MYVKETTVEKYSEESQTLNIKIQGKRSLLAKSIYLIESRGWDKKTPSAEKWLSKICLGFLAFSTAYFAMSLLVR